MSDEQPAIRRHRPTTFEINWKVDGHKFRIEAAPRPPEFVPGFVVLTQPNLSQFAIPADAVEWMDWQVVDNSSTTRA